MEAVLLFLTCQWSFQSYVARLQVGLGLDHYREKDVKEHSLTREKNIPICTVYGAILQPNKTFDSGIDEVIG